MEPATTIIIPAFMAATTIDRTLASVAAQTRPDWEAIVVDDGSTDETVAIVARQVAADPRIRLLRPDHLGAAAARNLGLAEAHGAWTLFLDADDTIDRRFLARMRARLRADPRADAAVCGHIRRATNGDILARYAAPRLDHDPIALCSAGPPMAMHAILSRTEVLRRLGGFDRSLVTNEDWDLWLRLARGGARFAVERRALAHYWSTPASLTRNGAVMLGDTLTMLGRIAAEDYHQRAFDALLWNGGIEIGAGGDALALPALVAELRAPVASARSVGALAEGLMLGADRPFPALLGQWAGLGPRVTRFLDRVGECCAAPAAASVIGRQIEREVLRAAGFRGSVRAGRSLGVMLAPWHLLRGIPGETAVDRVVIKVPLVRPRSLLMIEADLADGLSGAALARLLGARVSDLARRVCRIGR